MENEAKQTYEVIITTTFRYRTTVEAASKKEAEDIVTREIVEKSSIDLLDTDDIDTDVDAYPVKSHAPAEGLPSTVTVDCGEVGISSSTSADEAVNILSDYLSDAYGYCQRGFVYELSGGKVVISGIDWDDDEESDDE